MLLLGAQLLPQLWPAFAFSFAISLTAVIEELLNQAQEQYSHYVASAWRWYGIMILIAMSIPFALAQLEGEFIAGAVVMWIAARFIYRSHMHVKIKSYLLISYLFGIEYLLYSTGSFLLVLLALGGAWLVSRIAKEREPRYLIFGLFFLMFLIPQTAWYLAAVLCISYASGLVYGSVENYKKQQQTGSPIPLVLTCDC